MSLPLEVLITGAGPTGLILANLLARQGIKLRIVDENSGRAKESRALAIQPRTLELFQSFGLIDQFLERGYRTKGLRLYLKGKKLFDLNFEDIGRRDTPYPYICVVPQSITEELLEESLQAFGITVERQTKLVSFSQSDTEVTAVIQKADSAQESIQVAYLVGCDGARSQVRQSAGLRFEGGTYDSDFMLADAKVDWDLPRDRMQIFLGDRHTAMYVPFKNTNHARIITIGKKEEGMKDAIANLTTKMTATIEEVQADFQDATSMNVQLKDSNWVTRYRVHHRCVEKLRLNRIFLAGDSAHVHSPAGGQGMNTGLQDAANLAWKLALVLKNQAPDSLLDTYQTERWPIAQRLLKFTDRIFSVASSLNVFIRLVRNIIAPIVGKLFSSFAVTRQFMFGFVSQLNIRYHKSEYVTDDIKGMSRDKHVHVGCRAPDAVMSDSTTLFDLIKGYQFHVLVMSRHPITIDQRKQFETKWHEEKRLGYSTCMIHWLDNPDAEQLYQTYDVDEVLVSLVRPDGYIAYQRDFL